MITLGVLRSLHKQTGPLALIHFDAHCDTWSDHFGEPLGHGTWLRNAIQEGLVDPNHVISVGLRSPVDTETSNWLAVQGGSSVTARQALKLLPDKMAEQIAQKALGPLPVYVSLDIDCLDPAHAPGTGTPEIGGFTTAWLSEVLDQLFINQCHHMQWAGLDVVEVAPAYDHAEITALAAATFVWQYASMISYLQK